MKQSYGKTICKQQNPKFHRQFSVRPLPQVKHNFSDLIQKQISESKNSNLNNSNNVPNLNQHQSRSFDRQSFIRSSSSSMHHHQAQDNLVRKMVKKDITADNANKANNNNEIPSQVSGNGNIDKFKIPFRKDFVTAIQRQASSSSSSSFPFFQQHHQEINNGSQTDVLQMNKNRVALIRQDQPSQSSKGQMHQAQKKRGQTAEPERRPQFTPTPIKIISSVQIAKDKFDAFQSELNTLQSEFSQLLEKKKWRAQDRVLIDVACLKTIFNSPSELEAFFSKLVKLYCDAFEVSTNYTKCIVSNGNFKQSIDYKKLKSDSGSVDAIAKDQTMALLGAQALLMKRLLPNCDMHQIMIAIKKLLDSIMLKWKIQNVFNTQIISIVRDAIQSYNLEAKLGESRIHPNDKQQVVVVQQKKPVLGLIFNNDLTFEVRKQSELKLSGTASHLANL